MLRNLMFLAVLVVGASQILVQIADKAGDHLVAARAASHPGPAQSQVQPAPALAQAQMTTAPPVQPKFKVTITAQPPVQQQPTQRFGHHVELTPDNRGHFMTDGAVNGRHLDFMVDTGASVVAINQQSAAAFGLRPAPGDFTATVTTANGNIKAARVRLDTVDIGGLVVHNVDAIVLPDSALSQNLLGMSYLSKLRVAFANNHMTLE